MFRKRLCRLVTLLLRGTHHDQNRQLSCAHIDVRIVARSCTTETEDIPNGKDYPAISRFKGAVIEYCNETKWGTYKLPVDEKGKLNFEKGKIARGQSRQDSIHNAGREQSGVCSGQLQEGFQELPVCRPLGDRKCRAWLLGQTAHMAQQIL